METNILKLEHISTKIVPCYGGSKVIVEYFLKTTCKNIINEYNIKTEIRGINTNDLHFNMVECEPITNNENTLTKEAIENLLNW